MILYFYDLLYPRKACAAAAYLHAPVTLRLIDVSKDEHKSADFLALNPNGLLPVLVDGAHIIWESNAILCHLGRKLKPDFWPADGRQVELIRWLSWDAAAFSNDAGTLYFELYIRKRFGLGEPDGNAVSRARARFIDSAVILDQHLAGRDWVVGNAPTAADFALGASLPYAEEIGLPLAGLPAIAAWYQKLSDLHGWKRPFSASGPSS